MQGILVKNRHAAQLAAVPFGLVFVEFRVDGLQEGSHEREFPCRANNGTLEVDVSDCRTCD